MFSLDFLFRYQKFYEHGEREALLAEVTELRDQVCECLHKMDFQPIISN